MYEYELTERGKILIAVVLVVLLLVMPSAFLIIKTMAAHPSQPMENPGMESTETPPPGLQEQPPVISESPPPDGGGFSPPDNSGGSSPPDDFPPIEVSDPTDPDPADEPEPTPPPQFGPVGGDPFGGTLSFLFSPSLQNTLDAGTTSMLDEFLASPKNTQDRLIAVELPQLSDEDAEKIVSALVSAFSVRGVSEQQLTYIIRPDRSGRGAFIVNLSYIPYQSK